MGRRKPATSDTHLGNAWALGRRYRRLSVRIRKPITMSVVLAVVVALTGPTAFAEDPITDPNAPATTTPSPSPDPSPAVDPSPSPDPSPAPSPEPSVAPSPEPTTAPDPAPQASPTISSDKDDYPPGGAVVLTGANWQPGEVVHIRVNDDAGESWRRDVDVIADGNGSVRDEFQLPDWFVALYTVTATGPISGTATTSFTDANVTGATVSIRTSATTTTCSATTATSFTSGSRACARSAITNLSNNNPGQTGDMFVQWLNPGGTEVLSVQHSGASGATFDDTFVISAAGTWRVNVCTNSSCNANQILDFKTFTVTAGNIAPVISLPGPALTCAENAAATIIDAGATATDSDSANFDTGTLAIDYSVGGSADDRLAIRNEGTAAGQIGVSGATVTFGGTTIGTFTGGTGITALVVTFNASSSPAAAQALMRNITYANVSDAPAASRTVRFVLTDGDGGTSNAATKVINVTATNDAPTGADKTIAINEDASYTFAAADFGFSDPDSGDSMSAVRIDTQTLPAGATLKLGTTTVANGDVILTADIPNLVFTPAANANGSGYASFTFSVRDSALAYDASPNTITFNVTATNDAPVANDDTAGPTDEDTALVIDPADLLANDTDVDGDILSLAAVAGATNGTVEIIATGPDAGKVRFTPAADYNGPASFTYKATDGSLESNSATVSITVNAVNDAPVIDLNGGDAGENSAATFTEDGSATILAPTAIVTDVDDANLVGASVQLTVNPPSGTVVPDLPDEILSWDTSSGGACDGLTLNYNTTTGTLIINGTAAVSRYQACLRSVVYENTLDAMDVTDRNAEFTVFDGHAVNSASNRPDVTITLIPVNDKAVATDGSASMNEDAAPITIDLRTLVSDIETSDVSNLTYNILSDPDGAAGILTGSGTNGTYSFNSADEFNGTATFTFSVTDRGDPDTCLPPSTSCAAALDSDTKTFTITVNAVNDAPNFTKGADETVNEDAGAQSVPNWATNISAGPADESGQTVDFVVTNNTNAALFAVAPAVSSSGTLTYTPAADANGSATITLKITDNGGTANGGVNESATQSFTITVNAVNDAPSFSKGADETVNEDSGPHTVIGWATAISAGPADESGQTVTFIVTNNNNGLFTAGGQPAVAPNGTLTYTSAPDANGSATVTVSLHDNGGTANGGVDTSATQTFTITVTAVNDPPVVDSASFGVTNTVCPATAGANNATLTVYFHDVDSGDTHTATIDWDSNPATTGDNQNLGTVTSSFSTPHSYPAAGNYTVTVKVSDGTLFDTKTATITVNHNTSGILQPVNWTQGSQDPSIFKWGSTVPVKVRFFNCDGTNAGSGLSVKIEVKKSAGSTPGIGDLETITNTNSPDSGGFMRWSGDLYIYNLNTGSLSDKTATYEIKLTVQSTGQTVITEFGTKAK